MSASKYRKVTDPETGGTVEAVEPMPIAEEPTVDLPSNDGKPQETKSDKYYRLMSRRLPRLLKSIESVENLCNLAQYESSTASRNYVEVTVRAAVDSLFRKLRGEKVTAKKLEIPR